MKNYNHQNIILKLNPAKHLLSWSCGTGKSAAAIQLTDKNDKGKTLVICPKSLTDNWTREIEKFSSDPKRFIVLTKENFRKMYLSIPAHNSIIVDEAHYFSGSKSQMSKSLYNYIRKYKTEFIYLLTATPYMSTPWNIYVLAKMLGKEWNYMTYKHKFFYDIRMGHRVVPVIKKGIEPSIAKLVNGLGSTVKLSDCIDVPDSTYLQEYFDLTKEQKEAIEELPDITHITRWTKTHQICGGTLKGGHYADDKHYKSEKLARLKDLCTEHKKVVVICRYNAEIANLSLKMAKIRDVYVINGKVPNRDEVVDKINKSKECIAIIQAACCEGYNLPTIPIMIFYSYDFSLKNYIQMKGRIQRIDAPQKCVYISLLVKGTIDEDVYKCIQTKKDFDIAIYNKP